MDGLKNLDYGKRRDNRKKVQIKLPRFTLKKLQKRVQRPRPARGHRRPFRARPSGGFRLNRDVPQPTQVPTHQPEVIYVEETSTVVPPPPPTPSTTPATPEPRSPPEIVYQSEDESVKIFPFQLSDAKPNEHPSLADATPEVEPTPSPYYYKDENGAILYEQGDIFPSEFTNSLNEFSSVSGTDGMLYTYSP